MSTAEAHHITSELACLSPAEITQKVALGLPRATIETNHILVERALVTLGQQILGGRKSIAASTPVGWVTVGYDAPIMEDGKETLPGRLTVSRSGEDPRKTTSIFTRDGQKIDLPSIPRFMGQIIAYETPTVEGFTAEQASLKPADVLAHMAQDLMAAYSNNNSPRRC